MSHCRNGTTLCETALTNQREDNGDGYARAGFLAVSDEPAHDSKGTKSAEYETHDARCHDDHLLRKINFR
jgi:hypothetical protein